MNIAFSSLPATELFPGISDPQICFSLISPNFEYCFLFSTREHPPYSDIALEFIPSQGGWRELLQDFGKMKNLIKKNETIFPPRK
jgi:hypothetical protein